jgi:PAS domain-containing protein
MTTGPLESLPLHATSDTAEPSWRNLLTLMPVAAYTCDSTGRITYFNSLAETVWGRAAKLRDAAVRYCGSYRLYFVDGRPMPHDKCWMALALLENKSFNGLDVLVERQDGTRTHGVAYANPLRDRQGKPIGAVTLVAPKPLAQPLSIDPAHTSLSAIPRDAALAMIEVVLGVLTGFTWPASTFE